MYLRNTPNIGAIYALLKFRAEEKGREVKRIDDVSTREVASVSIYVRVLKYLLHLRQ